MTGSGKAKLSIDEPLPETPWPVASRNLLTQRELSFYRSLVVLYPKHQVFVQVALSQLIDVPESHPERQLIRNRFSQLVADFVLCRHDLSVVAVIELDDRSHERPKRRAADARKNKACADAGLRLIRIPAGSLPSQEKLKTIIDADSVNGGRSYGAVVTPSLPPELALRLAEDWSSGDEDTVVGSTEPDHEELRVLRHILLRTALIGFAFIGGWFVYSQSLSHIAQTTPQPMVSRGVTQQSPQTAAPVALTPIPIAPVSVPRPAEDSSESRRTEAQVATDAKMQKELAWSSFYSAPASCEHPLDWNAQVGCGNRYMQAKRAFERQWLIDHPSQQTVLGVMVLDNSSVGGSHR